MSRSKHVCASPAAGIFSNLLPGLIQYGNLVISFLKLATRAIGRINWLMNSILGYVVSNLFCTILGPSKLDN